jgi:hypothetical protein
MASALTGELGKFASQLRCPAAQGLFDIVSELQQRIDWHCGKVGGLGHLLSSKGKINVLSAASRKQTEQVSSALYASEPTKTVSVRAQPTSMRSSSMSFQRPWRWYNLEPL